jgi:hypothetical protein
MLAVLVSIALVLAPAELLTDPEAKRLFGEAQQAFEAGDYATASARLESAYMIEPEGALLYPWAQAERQLDHCETAIDLYRKYIDSQPSEKMAKAAQSNIERCEVRMSESKKGSEPPPPIEGTDDEVPPFGEETATDDAPGKKDDFDPRADKIGVIVGATLVGVGVAAVAAGGTLMGVAAGRANATDEATSQARYDELRKEAKSLNTGGIVALSIGGALLVGGVVQLAIVGAKRKRAKKNGTLSMFSDGRTSGIVWSGRF